MSAEPGKEVVVLTSEKTVFKNALPIIIGYTIFFVLDSKSRDFDEFFDEFAKTRKT